jgi:hypothetical protein
MADYLNQTQFRHLKSYTEWPEFARYVIIKRAHESEIYIIIVVAFVYRMNDVDLSAW